MHVIGKIGVTVAAACIRLGRQCGTAAFPSKNGHGQIKRVADMLDTQYVKRAKIYRRYKAQAIGNPNRFIFFSLKMILQKLQVRYVIYNCYYIY